MRDLATGNNARIGRGALKEGRLREALRLSQLRHDLYRQAHEGRALVPLPAPVRSGWERYFYVRPDLARSPEGPALASLLAVVQSEERSGRRDFARRDWGRGGKLKPFPHRARELSEREFGALPEDQQRYFMMVMERRRSAPPLRLFILKEPWKFVSRVRAHYLTHQEIPAGDILSECAYVEQRLYGPARMEAPLWRLWGRDPYWYEDRPVSRAEADAAEMRLQEVAA